MRLRHSSRSVIALVTALLLFLCQAASAAQACAHAFALDRTPASSVAPCHESSGGEGAVSHAPSQVSSCESPTAFSGYANLSIAAVTEFPALTIVAYDVPRAGIPVQGAHDTHALCHSPPPLNLLHCRFLN